MATAHDYFDFLTDQIEISPANSQEELNAAQTISDLMKEHGLETNVEEFDAASFGRLPFAILLIVMFIGTFLAGIGGLPLALIGGLITLACVAVLVLDHLGNNILESFGPAARSQNVVAMHEASGPLVAKGNRPVVIMAHYDTPRESFLYSSGIAKFLPVLRRYTPWCVVAAGVSAFFQILAFLPEPFRRVFWVIGFLAAVVPLLVGIGTVVERFSSCSLGANDNKSSIAALLGVMDSIFSTGSGESLVSRIAQRREERKRAAAGVRHGEEVLRSLAILPEDCEIEYVEEPEEQANPLFAAAVDDAGATTDLPVAAFQDDAEATSVSEPVFKIVEPEEPVEDEDPNATTVYTPQPAPQETYTPRVADVARRAALFDLPDLDSDTSSDPFAAPSAPAPRTVRSTLADRLSLADEQNSRHIQDRLGTFDEPDGLDVPVPVFDDVVEKEPEPQAPVAQEKPKRKGFSLFGRKKQQEESLSDYLGVEDDYDAKTGGREIGSWEELEEQDEEFSRRRRTDPHWKGGAAVSEELRGEDGEPAEGEMAEASVSLGLDELLCHDIWFVALGANGLDHAGTKAFIAKHRPQLRGAFVINLDSVGAGELAVLSSEGMGNTRRADRRISRLLKGVAKDLSVDLIDVPFDWNSTDATPAMRSSMRAATIMGVNEFGLPALSRTPEDVPEHVDPNQIELVSSMVMEFIRRS